MMVLIMQQSTQVLPVRAGRVPWAVHALSTISVLCLHFSVLPWLGTAIWSSTSGFSKPFYREAPEPFPCPLLQGNSVGGWMQLWWVGLSEPWLPTGHPSFVVHPVSSPTIPTCAPGAVCHPLPLLPGALSCGVAPDSAEPLFVQAGRSNPSAISTPVKARS
jgi:hypothetical protein